MLLRGVPMRVGWLFRPHLAVAGTVAAISIGGQVQAALPPELLCEQTAELSVEASRLETSRNGSTGVTYRLSRGALFISSNGRPEYAYGKLVEQEPGRFTVGHKVLLLDPQLTSAHVIHVHPVDIRIANFKCRRLAG